MRFALHLLAVVGTATGVFIGCGSSDNAPAVPAEPVWKPTSTRLEMKGFGWFSGSIGYATDRADLSAEQLTALDGLRAVPAVRAAEDVATFTVTIVDADGSKATYATPGSDGPPTTAGIDYKTWEPFLATLHCSWAQAARPCSVASGAPAPTACKLKLHDDPGCLNGITAMSVCADIWTTVTASRAGKYHLAVVGCLDTTSIEVRSADGATVLGTSAATTAPRCPTFDQDIAKPGDYRVVVKKRVATCGQGALQEFFLQFGPAK